MPRHLSPALAVALTLVLLSLVLAPLPLGSVMPGPRTLLQIGTFAALAAALLVTQGTLRLRYGAWPAMSLAAVGVLGLLQSLSWPDWIVRLLAPALADAYRSAADLLAQEVSTQLPMSIAPAVTRQVGWHWLAIAAAFAVAAVLGTDRRIRRLLSVALLATAMFELVYGLSGLVIDREVIFGVAVPGSATRLRGTYVNADHLAFYLSTALAAVGAWLWWSWRRARQVEVLEQALVRVAPPAALFLLLFVGVSFTGSRAGLLAASSAVLAQALLLARHQRRWHSAAAGLVVLGIAFLAIAALNLEQGLGRWLSTSAFEVTWNSRLVVGSATLGLVRLCPWTGTGLGTFRQAFPWVQPEDLKGTWVHAHNDVLELLATTGLLGLVLLVPGLVWLLRRLWRVLGHGRRSEDRATALAALGALCAAAVHSLLDFGLALPANAYTLAVLCGAAAAARCFGDPKLVDQPAAEPTSRTEPGVTGSPAAISISRR